MYHSWNYLYSNIVYLTTMAPICLPFGNGEKLIWYSTQGQTICHVSSRSKNMNEKICSLKIDIQTVHSARTDTAAFGLIWVIGIRGSQFWASEMRISISCGWFMHVWISEVGRDFIWVQIVKNSFTSTDLLFLSSTLTLFFGRTYSSESKYQMQERLWKTCQNQV